MVDTSRPKPITEVQATGLALKALRTRAGLTQEAAAEAAGVQTQTWRRYEWGERRADMVKLAGFARALGSDLEELLREQAVVTGAAPRTASAPRAGLAEREADPFLVPFQGRVRAGSVGSAVFDVGDQEPLDLRVAFGPHARATIVAGESMTGYAEGGSTVVFATKRWPRRGQGCVVAFENGEQIVKLYKETRDNGATLVLEELWPERRDLSFDMGEVRGVYAVLWREG